MRARGSADGRSLPFGAGEGLGPFCRGHSGDRHRHRDPRRDVCSWRLSRRFFAAGSPYVGGGGSGGVYRRQYFDGVYDDVYRLARSLCLLAAADAGVIPIDTIHTDFKDEAGLAAECAAARRSGFAAKMAIHPAQIPNINQAFAIDEEELAWARKVVQAFADNPDAGTIAVDGKMIDKPHLTLARRLLGDRPIFNPQNQTRRPCQRAMSRQR